VEEDRDWQAALCDRIGRPAADGHGRIMARLSRSPAGERVRSFTIVTTTPNELCAELHNRIPVVLKRKAWPVWLAEQLATVSQLKALLGTLPFRGHDLLACERARRQRQEQ
jgi:putative SOS response-associated peptidase YedK